MADRKPPRCGICRNPGHNARTCSSRNPGKHRRPAKLFGDQRVFTAMQTALGERDTVVASRAIESMFLDRLMSWAEQLPTVEKKPSPNERKSHG